MKTCKMSNDFGYNSKPRLRGELSMTKLEHCNVIPILENQDDQKNKRKNA